MANLFQRLSAAVKTFNEAEVNTAVVKVMRDFSPVDVEPGLTAIESAVKANLIDEDQENIASFTIINIDGSEVVVSANYICKGGQTLKVAINRDSKG